MVLWLLFENHEYFPVDQQYPKTTWATSLELDEMVSKMKGRHDTIDDFIRKVFEQWLEWRDTISFIEEAYTKQSTRIEDYVKQIEELKKKKQ